MTPGGHAIICIMSRHDRVLNTETRRKLNGERALLAAVLAQAVDDAAGANGQQYVAPGRQYFAGGDYVHHLTLLDLPDTWLPEAFDNAANRRTGKKTVK